MTTANNTDKDFMKTVSFLLLTAIFLIITRDLSVLCHEWAHGVVAYFYGYQHLPFALQSMSWSMLHTYSVDSGSLYANLFLVGQKYISANIAIAGPAINFILMLLGALLIANKNIRTKPLLAYFLFWFTLNNFGQVYSYIPDNIFAKTGDVAYFLDAYALSPWYLLIPVTLALFFLSIKIMIPALMNILAELKYTQIWLKNTVLLLAIALVFFWYGFAIQDYYGTHYFNQLNYPFSVFAGFAVYLLLMRSPKYVNN